MDVVNGAGVEIDEDLVPEQLRQLIPFVKRWAFKDSEDQDEFVALMLRDRAGEVDEFNRVMDAANDDFTAWLRSLPFHKHIREFSAKEWRHPFWSFLAAFKVRELTGPGEDTPASLEMQARYAAERRVEKFREATAAANEAFRKGDYLGCVLALKPFEDLLSPAQRQKARIATARARADGIPGL